MSSVNYSLNHKGVSLFYSQLDIITSKNSKKQTLRFLSKPFRLFTKKACLIKYYINSDILLLAK